MSEPLTDAEIEWFQARALRAAPRSVETFSCEKVLRAMAEIRKLRRERDETRAEAAWRKAQENRHGR